MTDPFGTHAVVLAFAIAEFLPLVELPDRAGTN